MQANFTSFNPGRVVLPLPQASADILFHNCLYGNDEGFILFYFFPFPNTFGKLFQAVSFMAEYSPWPIYMLITEVLPFTDKYLHVN